MILAALFAARFLHFVSLAVAFGAAMARVGSATDSSPDVALRRWSGRVLVGSAAVTLTTAVLLLGGTAANLVGAPAGAFDLSVLATIVQETDFGRVWVARLAAATLLVVIAAYGLAGVSRPTVDIAAMVLAAALLASLALTGHAAVESGTEGWIHRSADAVHLIAAGVWLGALPPFLYMLRLSGSPSDPGASLAAERLAAFHTVGLVAVIALVGTGLVNSWFLVGTLLRLLTTPYGLLLTAKLVLFAAMLGLAADNRFRLVPALLAARTATGASGAVARVRSSIRAEWLLSLLLLGAVALLGMIEPAVTDAHAQPLVHTPPG